MQYSEAKTFADNLRELADWFEVNGPKLPDPMVTAEVRCWLTSQDYKQGKDGKWETTLNEEQTKQKLKKFLEAIGSCEKDYSDDRLIIRKRFGHNVEVRGSVNRAISCKKKVTGQKFVKEYVVPARWEEEYEWDCDDSASLLKLVES